MKEINEKLERFEEEQLNLKREKTSIERELERSGISGDDQRYLVAQLSDVNEGLEMKSRQLDGLNQDRERLVLQEERLNREKDDLKKEKDRLSQILDGWLKNPREGLSRYSGIKTIHTDL